MTITQQQAIEALTILDSSGISAISTAVLRQYIEQSTAQPQAVVPAPSYSHSDVLEAHTKGYELGLSQVDRGTAQAERAPVVQATASYEEAEAALAVACTGGDVIGPVQMQRAINHFIADRASSGATPADVRMLTPQEPEKCYSLDEETFHEFGDFIDMLDEEQAKPGFLVYEGESVRHTASHYARGAVADLFERMGEQAFDDAGEHIGDWPDHAVKGNNSAELEKLIYDWLDANVKVNFYTIKNVREIALTAEMLGDNDAGKRIPADGVIGGV